MSIEPEVTLRTWIMVKVLQSIIENEGLGTHVLDEQRRAVVRKDVKRAYEYADIAIEEGTR